MSAVAIATPQGRAILAAQATPRSRGGRRKSWGRHERNPESNPHRRRTDSLHRDVSSFWACPVFCFVAAYAVWEEAFTIAARGGAVMFP
jgi:hypothetical protein